ncbi:hypothetical protein L1887_40101 [Cichorium endivia]|nr:hypothetical protein L1887_40101 [Cichorium endivia]
MADISFKTRYIYIDVGARNYGSSIGGWFKKLYPKQNKPFKIFAIESDRQFHQEYKSKKKDFTFTICSLGAKRVIVLRDQSPTKQPTFQDVTLFCDLESAMSELTKKIQIGIDLNLRTD